MKRFSWLFLLISTVGSAQKLKKADKLVLTGLQTHISFLADDKLEGRRTGTAGEKLAYEYISSQFAANGLMVKGDNGTYIQDFEVNEGKQINPSTQLTINNNRLLLEKDFFLSHIAPIKKPKQPEQLLCPKAELFGFGT